MITPRLKTPPLSSGQEIPTWYYFINNMRFRPHCIHMYLFNIIQKYSIYTFPSNLARKGIRYSIWIQDTSECQSGRGMEEICVGGLTLSQDLCISQHVMMMIANHQPHVLICFDFHCKSAQVICGPNQLKTITKSVWTTRTSGKHENPGLQRRRF